MEQIVQAVADTLGTHISNQAVVFLISMVPILELRGGLLAAKLLSVPMVQAIPLCILGNIIPIPFILLLIRRVLQWMKKIPGLKRFAFWLEAKADKRSGQVEDAEFVGLMLFVGIPLPGTGAWTGSLIAALLEIDFKKSIVAELYGIVMATVICSILWYGLLGIFI